MQSGCSARDLRSMANFALCSNRTRFSVRSGRSLPSGFYTWGDFTMHTKSIVWAALLAALAGAGNEALAQYGYPSPYGYPTPGPMMGPGLMGPGMSGPGTMPGMYG